MKQPLQHYYVSLLKAVQALRELSHAASQAVTESMPMEEAADAEFVYYKAVQLIEEFLKENRAAQKRYCYFTCIKFIAAASLNPNLGNVKTDYVTATPDVTMMPRIPSETNPKEREEYHTFLAHFGINAEAVQFGVVRPHWPGVLEMIKERQANGQPLPPGTIATQTFPQYSIRHTPRKGKTIVDGYVESVE